MGTWMWKRVMNQILKKDMKSSQFYKSHHFLHYFDPRMDHEGDEIMEQELLEALCAAGVNINERGVKVLI
jgi:hypothetical protein